MFQPHAIVYNGRRIMLTCHTGADYRRVPLSLLLNPLRYSVTFNPGRQRRLTINREGRLNFHWANFNWWLWKRRITRAPDGGK